MTEYDHFSNGHIKTYHLAWVFTVSFSHIMGFTITLILKAPNMEIDEFENSIDPDEVAHNESPHPDLHCL